MSIPTALESTAVGEIATSICGWLEGEQSMRIPSINGLVGESSQICNLI
jgi:hypothetical protein